MLWQLHFAAQRSSVLQLLPGLAYRKARSFAPRVNLLGQNGNAPPAPLTSWPVRRSAGPGGANHSRSVGPATRLGYGESQRFRRAYGQGLPPSHGHGQDPCSRSAAQTQRPVLPVLPSSGASGATTYCSAISAATSSHPGCPSHAGTACAGTSGATVPSCPSSWTSCSPRLSHCRIGAHAAPLRSCLGSSLHESRPCPGRARRRTSTTAGPRPRGRRRTGFARGSIAPCWRSSTGSPSARRSTAASRTYRPISMPGSPVTMKTVRIRAAGASARRSIAGRLPPR
jgi:hypothetical protein